MRWHWYRTIVQYCILLQVHYRYIIAIPIHYTDTDTDTNIITCYHEDICRHSPHRRSVIAASANTSFLDFCLEVPDLNDYDASTSRG